MYQSPTTGEFEMNSYTTVDPVRQTEASTEAANTLRTTSNCIVRQTIKIISVVKRIAIFVSHRMKCLFNYFISR